MGRSTPLSCQGARLPSRLRDQAVTAAPRQTCARKPSMFRGKKVYEKSIDATRQTVSVLRSSIKNSRVLPRQFQSSSIVAMRGSETKRRTKWLVKSNAISREQSFRVITMA
jgi:hypothetical protein